MDGSDFKELFMQLMSAGAGRPVGKDGIPAGPWTPELLANAISQITSNSNGIDLRTVQHWFERNDKGISAQNIRWLAHIFGCGDPEATTAWQAELNASRLRFITKRRSSATAPNYIKTRHSSDEVNTPHKAVPFEQPEKLTSFARQTPPPKCSLALRTESLFSSSPLNMPSAVFACAVALGFVSFLLGNHDLVYHGVGGSSKQVGFIWAPNWTLLFWIFMPLFLGAVSELTIYWKEKGRFLTHLSAAHSHGAEAWLRRLQTSNLSFWAVFLICMVFAGLMQWIGIRLLPLLNNSQEYATDWGTIAIDRPDIVSVPMSIAFTGFAYVYMSICFYLFFAGLVLLYSMVQDFRDLRIGTLSAAQRRSVAEAGNRVMQGLFRCSLLGILIALCMKLQSAYLISTAPDILSWLINDMASALSQNNPNSYAEGYRTPNQFSSLLIVLACCFVFFYGAIQMGSGESGTKGWTMQSAFVLMLATCYLSVNAFVGFTFLLTFGLTLAIYGIFNPGLGTAEILDEEPIRDVQ